MDEDSGVGLYWGVRESFVRYVAAGAEGQIYGDDGVETDGRGTFRFPLREAQRDASGWRIDLAGELRFIAHFGALDVAIVRPRLELADRGLLSFERGDRRREVIATVTTATPHEVGGRWVWPPLEARLTAAGSAVFGDVYGEGAPLDPLRLAIPLHSGPEAEQGTSNERRP